MSCQMNDARSNEEMPDSAINARLEWKLVGKVSGRFFVARYQRGYRWGQAEVRKLLDDIWQNGDAPYSLQPVVVKKNGENDWELVDGQQRFTTIYLIFLYMRRAGLKNVDPPFTIEYETRPTSADYLKKLDAETSQVNIDFFHLHAAYEEIQRWFESHQDERQVAADEFYRRLFRFVRVIWYEAPRELDSTALFTRLNVGRIPLTNAELFKALLLSRCRGGKGRPDRSREIAAQWDAFERDLRNPDVWAFVTDMPEAECPTRIALLLDTIAGGPTGRARPVFHTFEVLREQMDSTSPEQVWNQVVDLHALVLGWYENRDLYHKIGYLVAGGKRFGKFVDLADGTTKSRFEAALDQLIRDDLDLSPSGLADLKYDNETQKETCARLLLLMNVETTRKLSNSTERYPFRMHRDNQWSLEHIHAQQAEGLVKAEQWKIWLQLHCDALRTLPEVDPARRDALVAKIEASLAAIDRNSFENLARDVMELFKTGEAEASENLYSVHSVTNLALLACGDNSALGNSVFEVKRRKILELDRQGAFIPLCTRQVFLKYFSNAEVQQPHFWSVQDRASYLAAITELVEPYLLAEERTP